MDGDRFDDLTRRLAHSVSRRSAVKSGIAALLGAIGMRGSAASQVTQAQCGNVVCAANPGACKPGCVCCVYGNGNSRCRPPQDCTGGGVIVAPTTSPPTTTTLAPTTTAAPPTTTAAPTTPPPTSTTTSPTTAGPTTTAAPTTTTSAPPTTSAPTTTAAPTTTTTAVPTTTTTTATPTTTTTATPDDGLTCTDLVCDPIDGCEHVLRADSCLIEGACYAAGALNPENGCQGCDPAQDQRQWTVLIGTPCGDGCLTNGTCQIRGGVTGASVICAADGVATDGCAIGGVCYPAGTIRPSDPCQVCDPARTQIFWSFLDDDTPCTTGCRTGVCFSGACGGGTVSPGFCSIGGVCRSAGETDPATGPCRVCDPARDAERWSNVADGVSCPNLCATNPTCQAGVCTGEGSVVCLQPSDLELCQHAVCDPETGGCVRRPLPNGRSDIKDCEQCRQCLFGECTGGTQPVDCGDCGACDPVTGTCAPKLEGADCGSDCTTSRRCNSAGICVAEPGLCDLNVGCEARVCDQETQQCVETGANDGRNCADDPCSECRGGTCGPKQCGACQRCDPANGQCVPCEPCCDGICGQSACKAQCGQATCKDVCCDVNSACCTSRFGQLDVQICQPKNLVCNGKCYRDPVTCCNGTVCAGDAQCCGGSCYSTETPITCCDGTACPEGSQCCGSGGTVACCPPGQLCCGTGLRGCCDAASEICGTFGCVTRV